MPLRSSPSGSDPTPSCLRLLATPCLALQPWPATPAPIGAVLVADVRAGIAPLAQALRAQRSAAWCPVCLVVDGGIAPDELYCFEPWPSSFALAVSPPDSGWPPAEVILRTVRARPRPEPADLAAYVAFRTGAPELEALLKARFVAPVARSHRSPRTVARHLTGLGSLLPHEWSRLGELVGWLLGSWECGGSIERKAAHAGIDQRTLRRWLDRLLGVSPSLAAERPGWEWILELALRRFGYIPGVVGAVSSLRSKEVG